MRVARVAVNLLANELYGHVVEIGLQLGIEINKFAPKHLIDEAAGGRES